MNINEMKIKRGCLLMLCQLLVASSLLAKVTFAYPYADGMVLQRNQAVVLKGCADKNEPVTVTFQKKKYHAVADAQGEWQVTLPPHKAGGPYTLQANEVCLKDVLFGDVWLCSGQSNMELPTRRVMDKYADELVADANNQIRLFKVQQNTLFDAPGEQVLSDGWKSLNQAHAKEFSAVAYFFAKEMFKRTGVPQGVVQAAVGGTPIQSWIGLPYLKEYPLYQAERMIGLSKGYRRQVHQYEAVAMTQWQKVAQTLEQQLPLSWKQLDFNDQAWETVDVFQSPWATNRDGVINGIHWFRKQVELTSAQVAQKATLRLGCFVDADSVFVNGVFVGTTGYRYPPRIYTIPQGVLKAGANVVAVRLVSNVGKPEFVPEKFHGILLGESPWMCQKKAFVAFDAQWKHQIAAQMPQAPGNTFFYYSPTVLYNGMIAPLAPYRFAGALWYQGESNVTRAKEYKGLLVKLMQCWRTTFNESELPFFIVEMADYERPVTAEWRMVQQAQREAAQADARAEVASAKDLGEWNDIHPLDKKTLAVRLADQAMKYVIK